NGPAVLPRVRAQPRRGTCAVRPRALRHGLGGRSDPASGTDYRDGVGRSGLRRKRPYYPRWQVAPTRSLKKRTYPIRPAPDPNLSERSAARLRAFRFAERVKTAFAIVVP